MDVQHDEVEFPVAIRRDWLSHYPNLEIDNHWHDEVEFILIMRGTMRCSVNGECVILSQDEGIFINSRQVHDIRSENKHDCDFIQIHLHPVVLCATKAIENRFVLPVIENDNYPFQILKPDFDWQRNILDAIVRVYYMRHETTMELGALGQLFTIWEQIFLHSGKVPAKVRESSPQLTQLKAMISYIASHYNSRINLDDIRAAGNMGKTSCCQLFQKYLNQTPITYLTMFRLRKGAELLAQTDMPIVEISYEVGFSGASYFAEAFKKHMGEMPSEYRKKYRRISEERR